MATFTAYFDDSGSADNTLAVIAGGFVTSTLQAIELERNWKDTLNEFDVSASHMKEFSHSIRDFEKWKDHKTDKRQETERQRYLNQLLGHTILRSRRAFAQAILMKDYREVNKKYKLKENLHPFALCGMSCVARAHDWAREHGISQDEVLIVFESGTDGWVNLCSWVKKILARSLVSMDKHECIPLQASDLIAYEHLLGNRDIFENQKQSFYDLRHPLKQLQYIPFKPADWGTIHAPAIEELCVRYEIPKRD